MKNLNEMKIAIASDHAGYELKQQVILFLEDPTLPIRWQKPWRKANRTSV